MLDNEKYKQKALKILAPIRQVDKNTVARENFLLTPYKSKASKKLPDYYLIYFLLADLLGFKNLGKYEKIAWSFPIDYKGKAFLIEYRKFGVGVFTQDGADDEKDAEEITKKINGAVKSARRFYDYLAETAIKDSHFNVTNNNKELFARLNFLLSLYKEQHKKYEENKGKYETKKGKTNQGEYTTFKSLDSEFYHKSNWLAISCIEAFYSWTEHLFIHLAIIDQNLSDGDKISQLIGAEWKSKFKASISLESEQATKFYDELTIVRQQLRNFVAHGAFGKNGNAFRFHSATGAVPVLMNHKKQKNKFSLNGYLTFKEENVIELIESFISFLWQGSTKPAMYYTQECELPTILTYAMDSTYNKATKSMQEMIEFTDKLMKRIDDHVNMDW